VLPGTDCPQQPPASRTWQRRFDDEGKKVAMFSMTMTDLVDLVSYIINTAFGFFSFFYICI
jgi:non-lysosomal glucosylceramidase